MKSFFKSLFGMKDEYIGLSSFRGAKTAKKPQKATVKGKVEKSTLTGMIRRAS